MGSSGRKCGTNHVGGIVVYGVAIVGGTIFGAFLGLVLVWTAGFVISLLATPHAARTVFVRARWPILYAGIAIGLIRALWIARRTLRTPVHDGPPESPP